MCIIITCINTGGSDFRQISTNVTFPPGSSAGDQACISVPIYSDGVLERSEETFQAMVSPLVTQSSFVSVPFDRRYAIVTIVDTNSKWQHGASESDLSDLLTAIKVVATQWDCCTNHCLCHLSCKLLNMGLPGILNTPWTEDARVHTTNTGSPSYIRGNSEMCPDPPPWVLFHVYIICAWDWTKN